MTTDAPGRVCPLRYRYGAAALAQIPPRSATSLYVVGGLYGNVIRITPPLNISRSDVDEFLRQLDASLVKATQPAAVNAS